MGSMYEDRVLVDKILNGNKSAFALLIKSHEKMVAYMVSRIILEEDEVKDVCQEVFIKVYLHLEKFKFDSKLSTWIATIAYRYALNHLKKRKKVSFSNLSDEVIIDYTQPVDTPLQKWFYWEFSEIPPISLKDIRSFQRFCSGLIKNALRKWIL